MKAAITIFAVLIVGYNAGLLGNIVNPLQNVLDAATAKAQAIALRNLLRSGINQVASNYRDSIAAQFAFAIVNFKNFTQYDLELANATETSDYLAELKQSLADLVGNSTQAIADINAAITALDNQILNAVNPAIDSLNSGIISGATKLVCFIRELPKINEKKDELVNAAFANFTQEIVKFSGVVADQVADVLKTLEDNNCGNQSILIRPLCRTTEVS